MQQGRNPIDILKEGQVFSGKAIKLLPGQMAELAALGQKITAQLEVPLQMGERYFFQVASLNKGVRLNVLTDYALSRRSADQASVLLEKLQIPPTKENIAFTTVVLENGKTLSKELIQTVSGWLGKSGLADGTEALRFMMSRNLPMTENVFQALVAARSTDSMTGKMVSLQQMLPRNNVDQTGASMAISRLFGDRSFSAHSFQGSSNEKAVQLALALQSPNPSVKAAAIGMLQQATASGAVTTAESVEESLAAIVKNIPVTNSSSNGAAAPVHMMKEALVQLVSHPASTEAAAVFKEAVSLSIPPRHPDRLLMMQQAAQLTGEMKKDQLPDAKMAASLFQLASSAAASIPDQAAVRIAMLLGIETLSFQEPTAGGSLRDAFRFLGLDHEAMIASKNGPEAMPQTVKQELIKLMAETMPAPVREAAEQLVGRLNAQHILSADSGPLQQLVMQSPLQFGEFRGDVTIKWQGKKKADGKIDADFCRVLFYVEMPNLRNTVIDMQVQNRIVHVNIMAETPSPLLKKLSVPAFDSLKEALEGSGYRLSGVHFKEQPSQQGGEEQSKPPLARIMDDNGYTEVDIRI
ncbi:hypothetical protein BA724_11035 [Domibacillus iocasae]|uniref:Flagellar hook-length control protein-like C-terminal domain-containing protein n=1 Tax=Domibacillus iocasae TaxID=1714016 RepID=A0A1E7DKN0_9BACI|nr:hypothetical protein BA724_11035 [Domibacillus iocasae]